MVVEIDKRNNLVVLSLGGNLRDVKKLFFEGYKRIEENIGIISLKSSIYSTKAWGVENQADFLNQVVALNTRLTPYEVLDKCLKIEKELGRERDQKKKWMERVIDIDVLFYEDKIIESIELTVPHPFLHERNFVLYPLVEILPDYIHPKLNKTVLELKNDCKDKLQVIKSLD